MHFLMHVGLSTPKVIIIQSSKGTLLRNCAVFKISLCKNLKSSKLEDNKKWKVASANLNFECSFRALMPLGPKLKASFEPTA